MIGVRCKVSAIGTKSKNVRVPAKDDDAIEQIVAKTVGINKKHSQNSRVEIVRKAWKLG